MNKGQVLTVAMSAVVSAALAPFVAAQASTLRAGQYQITTEFTMPNNPGKLPPRTDSQCYTAEQLRELAANIGKGKECKVVESKMTGSTMTFRTECPPPSASRITGTVDFISPESYHAVINMKSTTGRSDTPFAQGVKMDITAKRVGACTE